jgi:hypothetical protein
MIWAADHLEEIAGLLYLEGPVMLSAFLTKIIAYTPEAMRDGSKPDSVSFGRSAEPAIAG